jgi:hypothetical protein
MFVSELSVPALHPEVSPWWPDIDGSRLVVVDANVRWVIQHFCTKQHAQTYERNAAWLIGIADRIDLSAFRTDWPRSSPRLVQQALYCFRSRSNRLARRDACAGVRCDACPSSACPFREQSLY